MWRVAEGNPSRIKRSAGRRPRRFPQLDLCNQGPGSPRLTPGAWNKVFCNNTLGALERNLFP